MINILFNMPNIFLKNISKKGDLIYINETLNIINTDQLISYLSEYLNVSSEDLILFNSNNEKEIFFLEEGKTYNFLVRKDEDFKIKILFDAESTDIDNNKIYDKYIIRVADEIYPFYNYEDKFYDYRNIDVLDRFSLFENIRLRDPYMKEMDLKDIINLYFKDLPSYDRKYIEKKISKLWEEIIENSYDDEHEDYDEYPDYNSTYCYYNPTEEI